MQDATERFYENLLKISEMTEKKATAGTRLAERLGALKKADVNGFFSEDKKDIAVIEGMLYENTADMPAETKTLWIYPKMTAEADNKTKPDIDKEISKISDIQKSIFDNYIYNYYENFSGKETEENKIGNMAENRYFGNVVKAFENNTEKKGLYAFDENWAKILNVGINGVDRNIAEKYAGEVSGIPNEKYFFAEDSERRSYNAKQEYIGEKYAKTEKFYSDKRMADTVYFYNEMFSLFNEKDGYYREKLSALNDINKSDITEKFTENTAERNKSYAERYFENIGFAIPENAISRYYDMQNESKTAYGGVETDKFENIFAFDSVLNEYAGFDEIPINKEISERIESAYGYESSERENTGGRTEIVFESGSIVNNFEAANMDMDDIISEFSARLQEAISSAAEGI
ncbi:MAG: hypothetical protein IJR59_01990 [Firmicutes bacterium]|nr:hypothetical protein [Bacillota bacterium]